MSRYGWVITQDKISEGADEGTVGPSGITDDIEQRLHKGEGKKFKMYDDDGELYYVGRYIGPDDETMFAPLDDFGMPNAGCTSIKYKNDDGEWEVL